MCSWPVQALGGLARPLGSPSTRQGWALGILVWVDLGRGRGQSPSRGSEFSEPLRALSPFSSGGQLHQLSGTGNMDSDWSHFTPNLLFMPQVLDFWNLKLFFSLKLLLSFSFVSGLPWGNKSKILICLSGRKYGWKYWWTPVNVSNDYLGLTNI